MLLKSIKYHNFRPFIGDQSVILACSNDASDENVTIILGDNTYGKTTFVLSFIWCLYGESRFTRADDILNKKVEESLPPDSKTQETAYVEVEFDDDNKQYRMRRTQHFTKNEKGDLKGSETEASLTYITEGGETKSVGKYQNDIDLVIKSILPLDLSSFFFFEGEKTNEIKRKDLGKSVRTLLGLEAYDKMRSHLYGSQTQSSPYTNSVMGDYLKRQNDESDEKAKMEFEKKVKAEEDFGKADARIREIDKEISNYEDMIEDINDRLRQAGPSKEFQARRDQISAEIKIAETDLEKKSKALFLLFSKDSTPLFVYPLLTRATGRLNKMEVSDKGIKGIEATAIRELLKRQECLCGCDLTEGSAAYKNVEKYIDYVPPRSLGTLVRDMSESIDEATETSRDFMRKFEEAYQEIAALRIRINELDAEDRDFLSKIKEIGVVDTVDAEENLGSYKRKLSELREERDSQISIRTAKLSEIETASNNFHMYKDKGDRARRFQLYYKYAEAIYNWVNDNYSKKETDLRNRLSAYISQLFNNMYTGKREITIDEKYNIVMNVKMNDNKTILDDTGGLRVIQYFSYVGGLVKLAYEIMRERESGDGEKQEALGEQYPLVLDAAFSHADEDHTKNIARELSSSSSQLVFALMKKDWLYAKEGLTGKVGRMYELEKVDEAEVQIREVK